MGQFLNQKPVTFSEFCVLFKVAGDAEMDKNKYSDLALKALGKSCENAYVYQSVKTAYENERFVSVGISCHKPRTTPDETDNI